MPSASRRRPLILAGMALGLTLFYLTPIPFVVRLHGLLLFAVLALLQPDLAILFVPLTAPLYLIPATLGGLRDRETLLPLHEIALVITTSAFACRWLWDAITRRNAAVLPANPVQGEQGDAITPAYRHIILQSLPFLLFLLCGIWGVIIALPGSRGEALREFRWLILEPLIFYGLLLLLGRSARRDAAMALIVAGSAVALIGLLQFVGIDLVPLMGQKRSFSENIVDAGSARRVASVYGHPNNLGLFLGRTWPLAAALALAVGAETVQHSARKGLDDFLSSSRQIGSLQIIPLYAIATLVCLAGVFVSFSRGAWLGALVACVVLGAGLANQQSIARNQWFALNRRWLLAVIALLGIITALALLLRGGGGSEGVRLLLWREAAGYIVQHPFGIGLDQFYAYHNPDSGRSLIDPSMIGTSDQYAAHPHNLVLDIWLRMGPVGLIAFGWLMVRFVRNATAAESLMIGALAALAAALTHGLVDQFYFVPDLAYAFWVLLALSELPTESKTGASQ